MGGASLDASKLSPSLVGLGVLLVVLGLVGRSITLFFTLFLFPQWGVKEKLYSMVSWCPKATVQAALATAALDFITVQIQSGVFMESDPSHSFHHHDSSTVRSAYAQARPSLAG